MIPPSTRVVSMLPAAESTGKRFTTQKLHVSSWLIWSQMLTEENMHRKREKEDFKISKTKSVSLPSKAKDFFFLFKELFSFLNYRNLYYLLLNFVMRWVASLAWIFCWDFFIWIHYLLSQFWGCQDFLCLLKLTGLCLFCLASAFLDLLYHITLLTLAAGRELSCSMVNAGASPHAPSMGTEVDVDLQPQFSSH